MQKSNILSTMTRDEVSIQIREESAPGKSGFSMHKKLLAGAVALVLGGSGLFLASHTFSCSENRRVLCGSSISDENMIISAPTDGTINNGSLQDRGYNTTSISVLNREREARIEALKRERDLAAKELKIGHEFDNVKDVAGPVAPASPGVHVYGTEDWISELERVVTLEAPRLDTNVQGKVYVYEGASLEYLMYLERIWALYQPDRAFQKKDDVWGSSGFGWQQKDPCSDFRGTGALGLKGIAYFWDKHTEDAHKLWDKDEKYHNWKQFPVATQFSNFCHTLLQKMKGIDPRKKVTREMRSKSVDKSSPLVALLDKEYRQSHNDEQPFYELVGAILDKIKTLFYNEMLDPNYMEMPILTRAIVDWIAEYAEELHGQGKSFADLKKALKQDTILYNFRGTHGHGLIVPGTPTWIMLGQQPPIDLNNLESDLGRKIGCLKRYCAGCCCVELSESQQIAKNALKSGELETVLGKLRFMGEHGYRFDFPGTYNPEMITID